MRKTKRDREVPIEMYFVFFYLRAREKRQEEYGVEEKGREKKEMKED